jgi:hypothetical protein
VATSIETIGIALRRKLGGRLLATLIARYPQYQENEKYIVIFTIILFSILNNESA